MKDLQTDPNAIANKKAAEQMHQLIAKKRIQRIQQETEENLEEFEKENKEYKKLELLKRMWQKKLLENSLNLSTSQKDPLFEQAKRSIPKEKLNALLFNSCQIGDWIKALILALFGAMLGPAGNEYLNISDNFITRHLGKGNSLHPMKEFGLILGIRATNENGIYSGIAHIGPTYNLMTKSINNYADKNPQDADFRQIADAFNFTNKQAKFYESWHSSTLSQKLLDRFHGGKMTSIPAGCLNHITAMTLVPDPNPPGGGGYIVFTNRWPGPRTSGESGTHIYRVKDINKIDKRFIDTMVEGVEKSSYAKVIQEIHRVADNTVPRVFIDQAPQKSFNCYIASPRANTHGILLCQKAIRENRKVHQIEAHEKIEVKAHFKDFTHDLHTGKVKDIAARLQSIPKDHYHNDLEILATTYIKQHPKNSECNQILSEALASVQNRKRKLR